MVFLSFKKQNQWCFYLNSPEHTLFLFLFLQINNFSSCFHPFMFMDMLMSSTKNFSSVLLVLFMVWSLLCSFTIGNHSDISCLRSIKESLEDPYNYLATSWNFNNQTQGFICRFTGVDCWRPEENRVLNIRLSDMGLKGLFPLGIENCSSLTGLDLSRNRISGPIPFDISKRLPYVTALDLSHNNFFGEIPPSIANMSYLNILNLNGNSLEGHIPEEIGLLVRIKLFSVANNHLSGPVPHFVYPVVSSESFANNRGLCGYPLDPCKKKSKKNNAHKTFFISGFVVGWLIFTVFAFAVSLYYMPNLTFLPKKKKITKMNKKRKQAPNRGNKSPSTDDENKICMLLDKFVTRMSLTELNKATNNFNVENIIGLGKMSTMYKAAFPNGCFLVIKRFHCSLIFSKKHFMNELISLGKLRHKNLVPLIGFCFEMKERLVIYKYMSEGNLYDWLHSTKGKAMMMEWPLRIKIAVGLARGLAWLHHHNPNFQVVHHNISSKCVLLDKYFEPKISNFGKATVLNPNEIGSSTCFFMKKKDVYSFGIVLLELVTGVEYASITFDNTLVEWRTRLLCSPSGLYDAVDKCLIGQGFDGEILQLLRIACKCIQFSPEQRPTMLEVYKTIMAVGEPFGLRDDSEVVMETEIVAAAD